MQIGKPVIWGCRLKRFDFWYIEPLYGFVPSIDHIAVADNATAKTMLEEMGGVLPKTDRLVAIYIPESTDKAYQPGLQSGRVVGAVRLLPMPNSRSITDYFYRDLDGSLRWPVGWPCEAIYAPPAENCLFLRDVIDSLFGFGAFAPYVKRFQIGPFKLERKVAAKLMQHFSHFNPLHN